MSKVRLQGNIESKFENPQPSNAREHQLSLWQMHLHREHPKKLEMAYSEVPWAQNKLKSKFKQSFTDFVIIYVLGSYKGINIVNTKKISIWLN